ncbi:MAG: hypothetical protein AAF773_28220 [Cyanobacteria bacterium P01_D01_bin.115]
MGAIAERPPRDIANWALAKGYRMSPRNRLWQLLTGDVGWLGQWMKGAIAG